MKVGVVRAEHSDGREAKASRYVNHLGQASVFGDCWESLAIDCGSLTAKCLVVLGDGAAWLWKRAKLPEATFAISGNALSEGNSNLRLLARSGICGRGSAGSLCKGRRGRKKMVIRTGE